MGDLGHKESWAPKNWCVWTVVLEKTLESPLDCKEIQPVHPKGNQSWIFIWRTDAEAETTKLWLPDVKNWLIGKDPDAGKDWSWEEKGTTEDEMVVWYHWLNGHEFKQAPRVCDGQGGLAFCNPWGCKESDVTEQLNKLILWPKYWSLSFIISPSNEWKNWFPLGLTGLVSLLSKGLSRVLPSTTMQKHQFFSTQWA